MIRFYSYIFLLCIGYSCNHRSGGTEISENALHDTIALDFVKIGECDSLWNFIVETNSDTVKFPDTHPQNLEECINQLDTCTNETMKGWIKCVSESEYASKMHHGFGTYLRNRWGLWANSNLGGYFSSLGIYQPDEMSGIILECFHQFVNTGCYSVDEKVQWYKEYWKKLKESEDSLNQINAQNYKETKRFVDSLHEAIHYEQLLLNIEGLVRDSLNFYIERTIGDTINLWTSGSSFRQTKEEYLKQAKSKKLGKSLFFRSIGDDGSIYNLSLSPKRFLKNDGNLFYEEERGEFVKIFTEEMICDPNVVNRWKPLNDCSLNKSFVKTQWLLNGKNYYYLELQGDCRGTGLKARYFIDENMNVILDEHTKNALWGSKVLFYN